jgi:hypothetical protein
VTIPINWLELSIKRSGQMANRRESYMSVQENKRYSKVVRGLVNYLLTSDEQISKFQKETRILKQFSNESKYELFLTCAHLGNQAVSVNQPP